MKYTVGPKKSYRTVKLQKEFEGKKIEIRLIIHSSLSICVDTNTGQETAYFMFENGQEYLQINDTIFINDIPIDKIPLTRMEKATLKHEVIDLYEQIESDKDECFYEDEKITFAYNVFENKIEEYEKYPDSVRERIKLLHKEDIHPLVYGERWGNNKVLLLASVEYETLLKMTETKLQEKKKSYKLRVLGKGENWYE
ncbi:hypothetical protein PDN14_26860 [Bacillus cereus group sp. Bc222]|uniref:hypothetical protein n=1 Tax=Bacillus cereus group TaxID=86661 RepID=UPI001F5AA59E|nr:MULTISPECIES: hypothetical protein [Bacillus cereus group]MDA2241995.1 hypothetical protein [Bacillus cereus group sp. Bc222]MEB9505277.1 hypothetical protein [Bacillus anthracis]